MMETRPLNELMPHPENETIYGDGADDALMDSIRQSGINEPLVINQDNLILSGHRRYDAAQKLNLETVPVRVIETSGYWDEVLIILTYNIHRSKLNEQIGREFPMMRQALHHIGVAGKRTDLDGDDSEEHHTTSSSQEDEVAQKTKPVDKAAEILGVSNPTAYRAEHVVKAIDMLEERGNTLEAEKLRKDLNGGSVRKVFDKTKKLGLIPHLKKQAQAGKPKRKKSLEDQVYISLEDYRQLGDDAQSEFLYSLDHNTKKKFNKQEQANIEWAHWSWNPITGCKHNCPYCYARDIANRFYPTKFEPTLWPERLHAPVNTKLPKEAEQDIGYKNVFTCSMADLFGRWVPGEWIDRVLGIIADNPEWNFLFLTKFPIRMAEFDFPDNAWVGTSVDCQVRVKPVEDAFSRVNAKVKWLSCEPMIEPLKFTRLDMFSWVVIGGASKSTQTPEWVPPRAWVSDLEYQARADGCMVYEKTNLQPIERLREFPGQRMISDDRHAPEALRYLPMDDDA